MNDLNYDIVLITTFINNNRIYDLLKSLKYLNGLKTILILVDMLDEPIKINYTNYESKIIHLKIKKKLSSSASRNIGLKYLFENIQNYNYLMYPDDDTTISENFKEEFVKLENSNYILNVLSTNTKEKYAKYKKYDNELISEKDIEFVGCVRFLFNKETIEKNGYFDERMGVGAKYGAGEDGDYFLRVLKHQKLIYKENLYTYHPAANLKYDSMNLKTLINRFKNYGVGAIFLFYKHKMHSNAIKIIIKALLGFLIHLLSFNLKISIAYFAAFLYRLYYFIKFHLKFQQNKL
jgi:hypothetical protein